MDKIRAAVIGCGGFAKAEHFPNLTRNPRTELVTVCSRSEGRRMAALHEWGAQKAEADAEQVFTDPDIDLIVLSVPHDVHFDMIMKALAAGKHVLCEKPMTVSHQETYAVLRAVKEAGVKLCVDYNRRYSPSMQYMRQQYLAHRNAPRVSAGQFVEEATRPVLYEETASMLMIRINDESSTYRPVHLDWETGRGQIIGETCHWLDLACWLLDDAPVRVYASGSARLSHVITLDFAAGHRAVIMFSPVGTFEYPKELFEIMDHAALFRNECFVEVQAFGAAGNARELFPLQFDGCPEAGQEGGLAGYIKKLDRRAEVHAESGKTRWPDLFPDKGHYQLLDAFVDAILNDQPSPISEVDGARATYLSLRAIESIRLGQPLPVNPEDCEMFVH